MGTMIVHGSAPRPKIVRIQCNAEQVCWNESELCCSDPYDADKHAIHSSDDPPVPQFPAHKNGRHDCKPARDVIKRQHVVLIGIMSSVGTTLKGSAPPGRGLCASMHRNTSKYPCLTVSTANPACPTKATVSLVITGPRKRIIRFRTSSSAPRSQFRLLTCSNKRSRPPGVNTR